MSALLHRESIHPLVVLVSFGLISLDAVLLAARLLGAPFRWWFPDTPLVVGGLAFYLASLGGALDLSLLVVGIRRAIRHRDLDRAERRRIVLGPWRRSGFFSLGVWPIALPAIAGYFVVATSNVTQISLSLIADGAAWRDPQLWALERGLHEWVVGLDVPVARWDMLYHNAWTIEATALFALILISRSRTTTLAFLLSFIVLFYVGRLLGLLNPVMGPAFYRPDLYAYLDGSWTAQIQDLLARLIRAGPGATWNSGVLMGGISAMPSLHVGLVTTCAYWLAVADARLAWFGVPWILLVWMSTVVLGWHYALDGLGGILTAWLCIVLTRRGMAAVGLASPDLLLARWKSRRARSREAV